MRRVFLSPSTQEHNIGHGGYGTEELRMNQVADVIERVLKVHGIAVFRNQPEWSLARVVRESNLIRPDIHLAIHSNAGGGRGAEVFAIQPGTSGDKLAKAVYSELESITPSADRGVKYRDSLYELKFTKAPAAIVEVAFHDNPEDAKWILENVEGIGVAIAKGVLTFWGTKFIKDKACLPPIDRLYRVQVGAFKSRDAAEALLVKLRKAGFSAIIKKY